MVGEKASRRKGLVIIFTGNGKGKTTAAMGMGVRAAGNKMNVLAVQFIKGQWKTGEQESLKRLEPYFELRRMGRGFTVERLRDKRIEMEEHQAAAREAMAMVRQELTSGQYAMVILDEILGSIKAGLVTLDEVLELIRLKPPMVHLVLTGRGAPPELIEASDLVTEMQPIKHPFQQGIPAQRGVEF
ncbi:MAG: cob(I)yrinic acid a,c-diamide adenosyltransferase [Chloroflexi bacterium]|nr:cob(I)yrinic acid a,c-diamide adenosyltransferase [Chloroflexota bacterium]